MAFAFLFAGSSEGYALIEGDVVAYDGRLADDRSHAVVDEQTPSNLSAGVNFDSRKQARKLRIQPGEKTHPMEPQPMANVMRPDGVQSGIADEDLQIGARGGVGLEDGGNILTDRA
jgi:hypothetical protein